MSTAPAISFRRAPLANTSPRTLVLSSAGGASYYEAASSQRETDWGLLRSGVFEDYLFTGSVRNIALARFRREVRNNPYLAGLHAKYPEAVGNTSLRSRTRSKQYNLAKERFWFRWSKALTHHRKSLRWAERILLGELLLAGELFVIKLRGGRIQLVASEFCGSPGGTTRFGKSEVNGIVYDAQGLPVAYRFGALSDYGTVVFSGRDDELVDARNVTHVFDSDRVLMGRGLPWLLAGMKTARDLHEITRAKTKQIKDVTSVTGAVEKAGANDFLNDLGQGMPASEDPVSAMDTPQAESADSPADRVSTDGRPLKIDLAPGTFVFLEPGEKLHQLVNEYKATDYKELIMLMLHAISAPVGLPVELWFSGLGDVNYSGFKGLGVQWKARRAYVCAFLEEAFHGPLHDWRIALAHALGEIVDVESGQPIANPDQDEDLIVWGWKRAAVLDDEKAAKANETKIRSGEASLGNVWMDNGEFPEEVLAERRQLWIALLVAAGELDAEGDHSDVKVPRGFLLRGELPGTTTYPFLPSGTGQTEGGEEAEEQAEQQETQPTGPAADPELEDEEGDSQGNRQNDSAP